MLQQGFGRQAAVVGAVGALVLSVAGCGSSSDDASGGSGDKVLTRTIKVGAFPTLNGLDVLIAQDQGYFKAEGLNVEVVPVKSAVEAVPQLQGGSLDIAETDMTTAILAKAKNFPLTAVAPGTIGIKPVPTDKIGPGAQIWCGATSSVASLADLMQVLHDDENIVPILHAAAPLARPSLVYADGDDTTGKREKDPGAMDVVLRLMKVMMDDREDLEGKKRLDKVIDRYHVLDTILPNLVTPKVEGTRAPLEVLIDVATDINRIDSSSQEPLSGDDYRATFKTVDSFLRSETRGMEQFYYIVRERNGN